MANFLWATSVATGSGSLQPRSSEPREAADDYYEGDYSPDDSERELPGIGRGLDPGEEVGSHESRVNDGDEHDQLQDRSPGCRVHGLVHRLMPLLPWDARS